MGEAQLRAVSVKQLCIRTVLVRMLSCPPPVFRFALFLCGLRPGPERSGAFGSAVLCDLLFGKWAQKRPPAFTRGLCVNGQFFLTEQFCRQEGSSAERAAPSREQRALRVQFMLFVDNACRGGMPLYPHGSRGTARTIYALASDSSTLSPGWQGAFRRPKPALAARFPIPRSPNDPRSPSLPPAPEEIQGRGPQAPPLSVARGRRQGGIGIPPDHPSREA